jgi:transcriptional antiterminator NusG
MQLFKEEEYWRVIYVASRQEQKVADKLRFLGIACYLPKIKKLRTWSDRKKWVDFPMFTGYLFVRPLAKDLELVVSQPGVVNFLSFERKHAKVSEKEIEIIKNIENSGYHAESLHTPDDFNEGETLLVTDGPLKGQTVTLLRKNNENIFLVVFEGMGQSLKVAIPYNLLAKKELVP